MCKAIDVAAYILNERGRLSGFQLQKLLFYSRPGVWLLRTGRSFPRRFVLGSTVPLYMRSPGLIAAAGPL